MLLNHKNLHKSVFKTVLGIPINNQRLVEDYAELYNMNSDYKSL